ncbi:AP-3 complex subunit delta [Trichoderma asperellum]|uniref:AP-3 complex subunit delta n=1 Tax=Trichoderma asperellum TaxID=101201 RepID=A0A6V8QRF6_TRIAP|nr:adaptin N terminal region-domain-containing protein [Trichoderma asperelloides]GFP55161.1 AP-3 complex subunit delta [Trichoderma asperellum]
MGADGLGYRFEKSLYDLIRGLRNHKGNEKEYIQKTLKECRAEVRSQDMDLKATALLKLIYLEMFGHDMSWASFHVLEVMSSPKYHQKRVGYLGAVQSFRQDTEVLMLATNLLKKDLAATTPTIISLPIATLPHVITPSLALSTLADLLPRLNHSHSNIRKKTLVTLYRLALVYPEALRAAWPKIKDRLMDPDEDPSVTAAIVNVVCELGWRRPHDFLPLAPRLFELLVDGGNNWMAIKLIKLFATLTPLEPRLVRKLLPPLTNIIRTTPAMSLLYECINGIIQGGILDNTDDVAGADEIATLCVNKLRGMIMMNGDANLKYVALLAFNKIVLTHPHLVSQQEDVILECIDSSDITIRVQALNLVKGMVTSDNLVLVVSRLMKQLKSSLPSKDRRLPGSSAITPETESDDESQTAIIAPTTQETQTLLLPDDYRIDIIERILFMCSKDNYSSVLDFDWYIDVLTQLVRMAPVPRTFDADTGAALPIRQQVDVSEKIGDELRNVAVKVRAMRATAVRAADIILDQLLSDNPAGHPLNSGALKSAIWIIGEYSVQLAVPDDSLNGLLQAIPRIGKPEISAVALHATAKVFSSIAGSELEPWTSERKSRISLLLARILDVLEPLALHPSLEVQERAVEYIELLKLTAEAASGQPASTDENDQEPPLLLTQAIPSLFSGWELNSVAVNAQKNVPLLEGLDLDEPINGNLNRLLFQTDIITLQSDEADDFEVYYHQRPPPSSISSSAPAISRLADPDDDMASSYQQLSEESYLDADILAKRKAERMEKNKDDPFYIPSDNILRTSTPIHNILQNNNGPDLDIDSIPVMQLDLEKFGGSSLAAPSRPQPRPRQRVLVAADETIEGGDSGTGRQNDSENGSGNLAKAKSKKSKQHSLLQVDSSTIGSFSLEEGDGSKGFDYERQQREEAEMQQAMKEVERLRLEMQRANERIQMAQGAEVQGVVITKKKKKKVVSKKTAEGEDGEAATSVKPKKKKKKAVAQTSEGGEPSSTAADTLDGAPVKVAPKKKKKASLVEAEAAG